MNLPIKTMISLSEPEPEPEPELQKIHSVSSPKSPKTDLGFPPQAPIPYRAAPPGFPPLSAPPF